MREIDAELATIFDGGIETVDGECWAGYMTVPMGDGRLGLLTSIPVTIWKDGIIQEFPDGNCLIAAVVTIAPLGKWVAA
jgi:hypothetical protein